MRSALILAATLALGGASCRGREAAPPASTDPAGAGPAPGVAAAATPVSPAKPAPGEIVPATTVVECPVTPGEAEDEETRIAGLLDAANQQISAGSFAAAWTCADQAADLVPTSVEAHHLRGAALAALGRAGEAQLAYNLALALDPDDPETLRAAADFYVNGKGERTRDALRLGLELAQRGSRRVLARRRRNAPLTADLAVLEAQALNDLGRSDEALDRIEVAVRAAPGRGDALHEKGVALFDLSRFAEARGAFARALEAQPEDAYTHQMLGLSLEQLGDEAGAARSLARARALAPGELAEPVLISVAEFRAEIDAILATLPPERLARVRAVRIDVADFPAAADLAAVSPPFPPTILGLYRGPVGRRPAGAAPGARDPHVAPAPEGEAPSIVLYRKNLARAVRTRAELSEQIRETLLHEIGHLEGLDEDDLRRRGLD